MEDYNEDGDLYKEFQNLMLEITGNRYQKKVEKLIAGNFVSQSTEELWIDRVKEYSRELMSKKVDRGIIENIMKKIRKIKRRENKRENDSSDESEEEEKSRKKKTRTFEEEVQAYVQSLRKNIPKVVKKEAFNFSQLETLIDVHGKKTLHERIYIIIEFYPIFRKEFESQVFNQRKNMYFKKEEFESIKEQIIITFFNHELSRMKRINGRIQIQDPMMIKLCDMFIRGLSNTLFQMRKKLPQALLKAYQIINKVKKTGRKSSKKIESDKTSRKIPSSIFGCPKLENEEYADLCRTYRDILKKLGGGHRSKMTDNQYHQIMTLASMTYDHRVKGFREHNSDEDFCSAVSKYFRSGTTFLGFDYLIKVGRDFGSLPSDVFFKHLFDHRLQIMFDTMLLGVLSSTEYKIYYRGEPYRKKPLCDEDEDEESDEEVEGEDSDDDRQKQTEKKRKGGNKKKSTENKKGKEWEERESLLDLMIRELASVIKLELKMDGISEDEDIQDITSELRTTLDPVSRKTINALRKRKQNQLLNPRNLEDVFFGNWFEIEFSKSGMSKRRFFEIFDIELSTSHDDFSVSRSTLIISLTLQEFNPKSPGIPQQFPWFSQGF